MEADAATNSMAEDSTAGHAAAPLQQPAGDIASQSPHEDVGAEQQPDSQAVRDGPNEIAEAAQLDNGAQQQSEASQVDTALQDQTSQVRPVKLQLEWHNW